MGAKRGSKRAASGGAAKKRGRPSKKQREEEEKQQQEAKDTNETTDQQQATDTTDSTDNNKQQADTKADDDTAKQSTDEAKSDSAEAADKAESGSGSGGGEKGEEHQAEEIEKGRLYFFYRPKVDAKEVKGTGDVQKFYILISPEGAEGRPAKEEEAEKNRKEEREAKEQPEGGKKHRLLVVSSKTLPQPGQRVRNPWSFVDAVGSLEDVEHKLERYSYDTKTRGHREIQPARLCGEARYELIKTTEKNDSHQTHLVYELEVPEEPTEVQQAFSIAKEGQFLINVKNPDFNSSVRSERPYAGFKPEAKAKIPPHLMEHFKGKRQAEVRYAPVMSTEFLDLPHAELVMIGVKKGVKEEVGEEFQRLVEELEEEVESEEPKESEKVYEELKMDQEEHPNAVEEFK